MAYGRAPMTADRSPRAARSRGIPRDTHSIPETGRPSPRCRRVVPRGNVAYPPAMSGSARADRLGWLAGMAAAHGAPAARRSHVDRCRKMPEKPAPDAPQEPGATAHEPGADAMELAPMTGSPAHMRLALARVRGALAASRARHQNALPPTTREEILAAAFAASIRETLARNAPLHVAVVAYARRLRDEGLPPEQMLVQVKAAVRNVVAPELDPLEARMLLDEVVRAAIAGYYRDTLPE